MLGRSALLAATNSENYGNWLGNYSDVSLLLRNGTPGPFLVPFDESPTPKTITAVGNASATTAIAKWNQGSGGSSLVFDGSGDYFSTPKNAGFEFGNGDFTVECWVKLNTLQTQAFATYAAAISGGSNIGWNLEQITSSNFRFYFYAGSSAYVANHSMAISIDTWYHLAAVRNGSSLILYVDGQPGSPATTTATINAPATALLAVGSFHTSTRFLNGYIDDLRITKGIARYQSAFTRPTTELPANITDDPDYNSVSLLLRGNGTPSGTLVPFDESPTEKTITPVGDAGISTTEFKYGTSSLAFDGSGDYLTISQNADFEFGSGDFTIECWVRMNITTQQTFAMYSSTSDISWVLEKHTSLFRYYYFSGGSADILYHPTIPISDTWHHLAVVRNGSSLILYVDGESGDTVTTTAAIDAPAGASLAVGSYVTSAPARPVNGYIDDLRITKGIARYTSNFTPPPAELPNF